MITSIQMYNPIAINLVITIHCVHVYMKFDKQVFISNNSSVTDYLIISQIMGCWMIIGLATLFGSVAQFSSIWLALNKNDIIMDTLIVSDTVYYIWSVSHFITQFAFIRIMIFLKNLTEIKQ